MTEQENWILDQIKAGKVCCLRTTVSCGYGAPEADHDLSVGLADIDDQSTLYKTFVDLTQRGLLVQFGPEHVVYSGTWDRVVERFYVQSDQSSV